MSRNLYQDYGSYPTHYATYGQPRRRKLDSRGASRGTGPSEPQQDGHPIFKVAFLGSQMMGKEEPEPDRVLDLIASLTRNLVDDHFRPRSYTLQITDLEVVVCETAAEWTERVPLRVIHYCMQGDHPHSRAFGFVASARQGFMGHVFMAKSTADAKELKRSFYHGFERAYQKYMGKQENHISSREARPQPPVQRAAPFVERPYSAPSYNAYYRYYPTAHPAGAYPQQYRLGPHSMEGRQAAAAANGQPYATRYYMKPETHQQLYRRGRPTDSFLHEYQLSTDPRTTRGRATRSANGDHYRSADRRARAQRSQTPEPHQRQIRRERHPVSDDMIY